MLATLATITLAVVVQDQTPLRAAPSASATTHAQLLQGDVLEVRGQRQDHVQVWDHRRERSGYVRASQLRALPSNDAEATQAQAVWRFLRDTPGQESLGIAYVAAYLKATKAVSAEPFEALGVMAERLAQRASLAPSARQAAAAAHLDVVAPYGVKFQSWVQDGAVRLCYQGDAFRQVLSMPSDAAQKAVAALALTRHDCGQPAAGPEQTQHDIWRAQTLDIVDTAAAAQIDAGLKNKLRLRRAGVWSAVAYQRARAGQQPQAAAQRALDELAAVDKQQLSDDDQPAYQEAALRVGAVRFAALPATPLAGRVQLRLEPGELGQTCVRVVDTKGERDEQTLAHRCTYGVVWPASARLAADGRALVLAVQPTATWTELWLFKAEAASANWAVNVLPPAASMPSVGYVEWAGFVPGQAKMLVAREALQEGGKSLRRFEVLSTDSLAAERWATTPELLAGFRWQDPQWKRHTVALR